MDNFWLTCTRCAKKLPFSLRGQCECGGTLLVEYDLDRVKRTFRKEDLHDRMATMWRYRELLPIENPEAIVSLGEGWTPLLRMNRLEQTLGVKELWIKREEQNPTGSFKARGFSAAVSLLFERGIEKVAVPSNGNAASALAAYAGRAGMEAYVFVPQDCPGIIQDECVQYGAHTYQVDGLIHDAARIIEEGKSDQKWSNVGTLREPGRVEGKKTMGWEIGEQFAWKLPEVIIYPTGGGSGIIGMWKAFHEMKELGFISGDLPRLVSVQEEGCEPLVTAMREKRGFLPEKEPVTSSPTGMRVPNPPDGDLLLRILRETGGTAVAVSADEIKQSQVDLGSQGISSSPEGASTLAGLRKLQKKGVIGAKDRIVLFNTAHALKYLPWKPERKIPVIRNYPEFLQMPVVRTEVSLNS